MDFIILSEFDNKIGIFIKNYFPKNFLTRNEDILIEKLIPDGIHNFNEDYYIFKSLIKVNRSFYENLIININSSNLSIKFIESNMNNYKKNNLYVDYKIKITNNKFLCFEKDNEKTIFILLNKNLNYSITDDEYLHLKSSDCLNYMIYINDNKILQSLVKILDYFKHNSFKDLEKKEFLVIENNFINYVLNLKDPSQERGTKYISLSYSTDKIPSLFLIKDILKVYILKYNSIIEDKENPFSMNVDLLLEECLNKSNELIDYSLKEKKKIYNYKRNNFIQLEDNLKLHETLDIKMKLIINWLKDKLISLYKSIVKNEKIILYSKNLKLNILQKICIFLSNIVIPLNIEDKIFFETLKSYETLELEEKESFILIINNPLILNKIKNFDLKFDLDKDKLYNSKNEEIKNENNSLLDNELVYYLKKYKDNVTDIGLYKMFNNLTKSILNYYADSSFYFENNEVIWKNIKKFINENQYYNKFRYFILENFIYLKYKFQIHFEKNYYKIFKSIVLLSNKNIHNNNIYNYELYNLLNTLLSIDYNLEQKKLLKKYFFEKKNINIIKYHEILDNELIKNLVKKFIIKIDIN